MHFKKIYAELGAKSGIGAVLLEEPSLVPPRILCAYLKEVLDFKAVKI